MLTLTAIRSEVTFVRGALTQAVDQLPFGADGIGNLRTALSNAAGSLEGLTGRDAQRVIGPRVNLAQVAQNAVDDVLTSLTGGATLTSSSLDDATRAVRNLANSLPMG